MKQAFEALGGVAAASVVGGGPAPGRVPWTCEECGTHYAGTTIDVPALGLTKRIQPPEVGDCKVCQDAEAKAQFERMRREQEARTADWFLKTSEIGAHYQQCTFDTFERKVGTKTALAKALQFVETWPDHNQWLLLWGAPGNGKTHLGMAIISEIRHRYGVAGLATTLPYTLKEIQASWNRRAGESSAVRSESWILDKLQGASLLLIDDLMRWPQWAEETMFVLLDGRYRNNRKTIFTSNHSPDQLEEILGPRLWSRFVGRTLMVRNEGTDYREEVERRQVIGV